MLSRKYKLSRTTFPHYTDQKFLWSGKVLRVQAYKKVSEGDPRFAVVVSKRLSDNAVMRNTFKRQIMEIIGEQFARFQQLPYQKYVITPREHLRAITRGNMNEDIAHFLVKHESQAHP